MPNTPNYHNFFDYPNWAYYPKFVPRDRKNVIKGCVYLADWFEGIDLICRLFVLLLGKSLPNNHLIVTKQKKHWANAFTQCFKSILDYELLHFFLYNRYWLSGFSIFVVQLWNKIRDFPHNLTGNTFKELSAKVRKYPTPDAVMMF